MGIGSRRRNRTLAIAVALYMATGMLGVAADWRACSEVPTRGCLKEEALQTGAGSLSAKERIDVLIGGGAPLEEGDIEEAKRVGKEAQDLRYLFAVIQFLVAKNNLEAAIGYSLEQTASRQTIAYGYLSSELVKQDQLPRALSLTDRVSGFENKKEIRKRIALTLAEKAPDTAPALLDGPYFTDRESADVHLLIARTYKKSGYTDKASIHFHQALIHNAKSKEQASPTSPWRINVVYPEVVILIRSGAIDQALRRIQELRPVFDTPEAMSHGMYGGYVEIIRAFCDEKHPEHAIQLVKSIQDTVASKKLLSLIARFALSEDQSITMIKLVSEFEPRAVQIAKNYEIRAAAKRGAVGKALQLLSAIENPMERRTLLVAIAQGLPK